MLRYRSHRILMLRCRERIIPWQPIQQNLLVIRKNVLYKKLLNLLQPNVGSRQSELLVNVVCINTSVASILPLANGLGCCPVPVELMRFHGLLRLHQQLPICISAAIPLQRSRCARSIWPCFFQLRSDCATP